MCRNQETLENIYQNWGFLLRTCDGFEACGFNGIHLVVLGFSKVPLREALIVSTSDINKPDRAGRTPLWYAVLKRDDYTVNILIDYGADTNAVPLSGDSPLFMAMKLGSYNIIQLLIESGARIEGYNELGYDAIAYWARGESMLPEEEEAVLTTLMNGGAVLDGSRNRWNLTPLHRPTRDQLKPFNSIKADLLLKFGADINELDVLGRPPLLYAVSFLGEDYLEYLINQGARLDITDERGLSVIHLAILMGTIRDWEVLIHAASEGRLKDFSISAAGITETLAWEYFTEYRDRSCVKGREDFEVELPVFKKLVEAVMGDSWKWDNPENFTQKHLDRAKRTLKTLG
jgi:ankyrin repeat protein